jgi:hypothetical protein
MNSQKLLGLIASHALAHRHACASQAHPGSIDFHLRSSMPAEQAFLSTV